MFDRKRRRNISIYASAAKLETRGRFYSEDDLVDYDVMAYDSGCDVRARALLDQRHGAPARSRPRRGDDDDDAEAGRGAHRARRLRARLRPPAPSARRQPEQPDRQSAGAGVSRQRVRADDRLQRSPRAERARSRGDCRAADAQQEREPTHDSARAALTSTATTRTGIRSRRSATTPSARCGSPCRASSTSSPRARSTGPAEAGDRDAGRRTRPQKTFVFQNDRPVRYLSCVISRMTSGRRRRGCRSGHRLEISATSASPSPIPAHPLRSRVARVVGRRAQRRRWLSPADETSLALTVRANPRQVGPRARRSPSRRAPSFSSTPQSSARRRIPTFTLAVTENELPGGHSPAYFAVLNQVLPTTPIVWRNDPVNFESFPAFYLAHELAHQWWGQAVGWKNYHEQWLSEGFAQYFAALYAEKALDAERLPVGAAADAALRYRHVAAGTDLPRLSARAHPRRTARLPLARLQQVGDRPAHAAAAGRRRCVLLRGAAVLRRVAIQEGRAPTISAPRWKRRRDVTWGRFSKRGSTASRSRASRSPIARQTPTRSSSNSSTAATSRRCPITVTLTYASGETESVVVPVTERVVERKMPSKGALRKVDANEDNAALVEIEKPGS